MKLGLKLFGKLSQTTEFRQSIRQMVSVGIDEVDGKLSVLSAVVSILAALGYVAFKLWRVSAR